MMELALRGIIEEFLGSLVAGMIVVKACKVASGGGRSLHKSFGNGGKRASEQISKHPKIRWKEFSFVRLSSFICFD